MKKHLLLLLTLCWVIFACEKDDPKSVAQLTTTGITEITQTTAISGGNITSDGGASVTARGVCWSTGQTPTINDNKTTNGSGVGSFTSSINGLEPNTTYYVRAYAINNEGVSYGSAISFKTLEAIKPPTVTTKEIVEISYTTAISGGNISDDGGAIVTARGVCWSKGETPTINDSKTEDETETGSFTSNITDLEPNTTYHIRAYATNSKGTAYGNMLSFTTQDVGPNRFLDPRDNNIYKFVTIGKQVWMAENLKYLPSLVGPKTGSEVIPYFYVYDYDGIVLADAKETSNYNTYGVLYNWIAAMDGSTSSVTKPSGVQGVCPKGWHLPSYAEWEELSDYLGGKNIAGGKLKESGTTHWENSNTSVTNEIGFSALPGGARSWNGVFNALGSFCFWWSSSLVEHYVYYRAIYSNSSELEWGGSIKDQGYSVRCVKD